MGEDEKGPSKLLDFTKVDEAIAQGKLWRAKEILQGRLRGGRYYEPLYERYGSLLLKMGDTVEAGKYLFFSGNWRDEYNESMELFKSRHKHDTWHQFEKCLPRGVAKGLFNQLPKNVELALREIYLPNWPPARPRHRAPKRKKGASTSSRIGCVLFAVGVAVIFLIGLRSVIGMLN